MSLDACFLSIDESKPLGIFWACGHERGIINLDTFLNESSSDMTVEMAIKYAERFEKFADALREFIAMSQQ